MPFAQDLLGSGPRLLRGTVSMLGHAAFPDHELRMKFASDWTRAMLNGT
jgi:hypothetical protein